MTQKQHKQSSNKNEPFFTTEQKWLQPGFFNEKNGHDFCKSQVPIPVYINKLAKRDIILMKNLNFRKLNNFSYLTMEKNE